MLLARCLAGVLTTCGLLMPLGRLLGQVFQPNICTPGDPGCPVPQPTVTISPASGTVHVNKLVVTITICGAPGGTDTVTYDGYNVSSAFTATTGTGCTTPRAITATIALLPGANTLSEITHALISLNPVVGGASATWTYTPGNPHLNTAATNGDSRDVRLCVANCFDEIAKYTTPAYTSLDIPRSTTLAYRSNRANPLVTVVADESDSSATPPTTVTLQVKRSNGAFVTFTNGSSSIVFADGVVNSATRVAGQFVPPAPDTATGAYYYLLNVIKTFPGGTTVQDSATVRVLLENERGSVFGSGWTVADVGRVYAQSDGSLVISDGQGSLAFFQSLVIGCASGCTYVSPAGDFTVVTSRTTIGSDSIKYDRRFPDGTTLGYRSDGRLIRNADRFGNATKYAYDASSRLLTITDPVGLVTGFFYGDGTDGWKAGAIRRIGDPCGRSSWFSVVPASNDLAQVEDPELNFTLGLFLNATYDANHRMVRNIDRGGNTWSWSYDFAGHLATDTLPSVTANGVLMRPVNAFHSLEANELVDPASGHGTTASPAARVDPTTVKAMATNPRGNTTLYLLDRFGASLEVFAPLGRNTIYHRNAASQITSTITPAGDQVDNTWTGPNLTSTSDHQTGATVSSSYEPTYNQVQRTTSPSDTTWFYWSAGKMDSSRTGSAADSAAAFTYDGRGRILTISDPDHFVTSYSYATLGFQNEASVTQSGSTTTYGFNSCGIRDSVVNAIGALTLLRYDNINRLTAEIGPLHDTTTFTYNHLYATAVRDAAGHVTQFFPNALGWVDTIIDPGSRMIEMTYDPDGNQLSRTNRRGGGVTATYDVLDQRMSRTADGQMSTYVNDPLGRFLVWSNGESVDTVKYDLAGRVTAQISWRRGHRFEVDASYNNRNLRQSVSIVAPWASTVHYGYGHALELDTLTDVAGLKTTFLYNQDAQPIQETIPNTAGVGINVLMGFPSTHSPSSITYSDPTMNSAFGINITFDSVSNHSERIPVSTITSSGYSGRKYVYDLASRLVSYHDFVATGLVYTCAPGTAFRVDPKTGRTCYTEGDTTTSNKITFAFDLAGNRTDSGAVVQPGNRLTRFASDSLVYDLDGNVTSWMRQVAGVWTTLGLYYWNSLGGLDSVIVSGSGKVSFGYDGRGRRVRKTTFSGAQTDYFWDGQNVYAETDSIGLRQREYVWYPSGSHLHGVRYGGTTMYYYVTEPPGNMVGVINSTGSIVNKYVYNPYGSIETSTVALNDWRRFASQQVDSETGLYYFGARYYNPRFGRFMSADPKMITGDINGYTYAANNPINNIDAEGDCTKYRVTVQTKDGQSYSFDVLVCGGDGASDPATPTGEGAYPDPFSWGAAQINSPFRDLDAGRVGIAWLTQKLVDLNKRAVTMGDIVFVPEDGTQTNDETLTHEFTHVEQQREKDEQVGSKWGEARFYGTELGLQAQNSLSGVSTTLASDPYDINSVATSPRTFQSYNYEQQADLVAAAQNPSNSMHAAATRIVPYTISFHVVP